jgi:signal transduction histidine kinase
MQTVANPRIAVCLALTRAISRATTVEEIYAAALDALDAGLDVSRSSILLFDPDGVMRFKASRGLSDGYRAVVEGHTPWQPDSPHPEPIVVGDVSEEVSLRAFLPTIRAEGIAAMAFIPLVSQGRAIGKFMLYYPAPHTLDPEDLQLADLIAAQVAFAIERSRAEEKVRVSEERLRFALDARLTAAQEASRLKDEFLAMLSHELRTPLNAILGWVQILAGGGLSPDRLHQAIDVIGRNAKLQGQLIEDILDVSRIFTGKMDVDRKPLLVQQVLDTAINGALPAASAKRIAVVRDIPDDLPQVDADPKRLQQVLGNVLSNAIKFTPEDGCVDVRCAADADGVRIEVTDSGIGIAPDFIPFVFDRFRQADSRTTRHHGGLGLGLAIARHLIELHGGTINARSAGVGFGTTFEIQLPVGTVAPESVGAPNASASDSQPLELRLDGATVLIVDDQRDSRDLLATLFDRHGAQVLQVSSAAAALDTLNSRLVHLLVADLAMPDVDGFELIERVRRTRIHLPAIAVSAHARQEDRHRAFTAGYSAYCSKPLETAEFLRVIGRVLAVSPPPTVH